MTIAPEKTQTQVRLRVGQEWFALCALSLLTPGRGVAALLPDGTQAAVFVDREGALYAIDNRDPFTGAQVLSRGLLGSAAMRPSSRRRCSSSASTCGRAAVWTTMRCR